MGFTNGGDGYGNGGEYIVRNLNEKTEYVYEIAYSPRESRSMTEG